MAETGPEGNECFQIYAEGDTPPSSLPSAIPGYEWAAPERVETDDPAGNDTYRYSLRKTRD